MYTSGDEDDKTLRRVVFNFDFPSIFTVFPAMIFSKVGSQNYLFSSDSDRLIFKHGRIFHQ